MTEDTHKVCIDSRKPDKKVYWLLCQCQVSYRCVQNGMELTVAICAEAHHAKISCHYAFCSAISRPQQVVVDTRVPCHAV